MNELEANDWCFYNGMAEGIDYLQALVMKYMEVGIQRGHLCLAKEHRTWFLNEDKCRGSMGVWTHANHDRNTYLFM